MIEIYLATLLFGLGTIYNNSNQHTKNKPNEIDNTNESNPYNQSIMNNISNEENKLAEKLDVKCKSILPRSFSNLLDPETSKLLSDDQNAEILKYVPKENSSIKSSLTGGNISVESFITSKTIGKETYNDISSNTWAIPHFGSNATQNMNEEGFKNKLDIHTGNSDFNFHKKETKNFFKPSKDIAFINGSPHMIDKLQDRYVKSNNRTSELPFDQVKVAPGIGQNYGSGGKGAFHQFEINDLVKPKNIDELRPLCNQQKSYTPPVQSGKHIDKRQSQSKVSKYRPDTFYLNTQSRWNKTPGAVLKQNAPQKFITKPTNRTSSKQVVGSAYSINKKTVGRSKIQRDRNNILRSFEKGAASNPGSWQIQLKSKSEGFQSNVKNEIDENYDISSYGKSGIKLAPNERDTTQNKSVVTNLVEAVKAIISPLQDKMKRTKKQNIEGNPNINGYLSPRIPEKITANDPNDIAKTTIKETTENNNYEGSIVGPKKTTAYDPNDLARTTIKETTENNNYDGPVEGPKKITVYDPNDVARTTIKETTENNNMNTQVKGAIKLSVYDPNDIARTTMKETLIHDTRCGNIDMERNKKQMDYNFADAKRTMKETMIDNKHSGNVSYNRGDGKGYLTANVFAPSTLKQLTSNNSYGGNISSGVNNKGGYTSNNFFAPTTLKQLTSDKQYTGSAGSYSKAITNYDSMKNARTNPNKEIISKGRKPTQNGVKVVGSIKEQGNVAVNKQNARYNGGSYSNISVRNGGNVSNAGIGNNLTKNKVSLSNKGLRDLYNPNNLNQLNNNPYALSINKQNNIEGFTTDTDLEDSDSL